MRTGPLLLGAVVLALALPSPAGAGTLFSEGFDGANFHNWRHVQSIASRADLIAEDPFRGNGAARFEVRDGDVEPDTGSERSEVSGPTLRAGQDLFIRDAIRVPSGNTYSTPWQIVQQLHEGDWDGPPGIAVFLDNRRALRLGAGDGSPTYWEGPALQMDRWYDLAYRVKLSRNPRAGFVEVWLSGGRQILFNGRWRMRGQTIQAARAYLKVGIYRAQSSTGSSIVEHDAIAIGTSLAAVTGG